MRIYDVANMIAEFQPQSDDAKWTIVRSAIEGMLKETDWTQGDALKYAKRNEFTAYRQALLAIDTTGAFPGNFSMPTLPIFSASDFSTQAQYDKQAAAHTFAGTIPNWATWTQSDLTTWWNGNLADATVDSFSIPAGVKTMLKAQNLAILREGQMLIALRDYVKLMNGS